MRPIIEVTPKTAQPEPYNMAVLGLPTAGYVADSKRHTRAGLLASSWRDMMRRCYDPTNSQYHLYGGRGVTVHKDWHTASGFISSVMQIPNSNLKDEDWDSYSLDKDYYGSNQYGPDTCVWLDIFEQAAYTSQARPIKATGPYDQEYIFLSVSECMRHFGCSKHAILAGLKKAPKGNNYCKALLGYSLQAYTSDKLLRRAVLPFRHVIAVDIETSGLDPQGGQILEVCCHLLDTNFEVVDTFEGVLPFNIENFSEFIMDMHTSNGLVQEEPTTDLSEVASWFRQYPKAVLLGSSIMFDHKWLAHHIPTISLSHRVIDVSSLKGLVDITDRLPETESNHRAASDIAYSLSIARLYRDVLLAS